MVGVVLRARVFFLIGRPVCDLPSLGEEGDFKTPNPSTTEHVIGQLVFHLDLRGGLCVLKGDYVVFFPLKDKKVTISAPETCFLNHLVLQSSNKECGFRQHNFNPSCLQHLLAATLEESF